VATAIHLRFDIVASSLPDRYKERLLKLSDQRIPRKGSLSSRLKNTAARSRIGKRRCNDCKT
jgi:hypothetical protein